MQTELKAQTRISNHLALYRLYGGVWLGIESFYRQQIRVDFSTRIFISLEGAEKSVRRINWLNSHSFIQKPIINISAFFQFSSMKRNILFNLNSRLLFVYLCQHLSPPHPSLPVASFVVDSKFYDLLNAFKTSADDIYHWSEIF